MSVDSSSLEREKLEGKDRDELSTSVTALGGKPGRSKKADLIDMILRLAQGDTSGASGDASGASGDANGARLPRARRAKPDEGEGAGGSASAAPAAAADPASAGSTAPEAPRRFRFVGWSGDTSPDSAPPVPTEDPEAALAPAELPAGRVVGTEDEASPEVNQH